MKRVVRPLGSPKGIDPHGDWMPIQSKKQMLNDARGVAQIVAMRLSLNYGEWWEDETLGFRVPEFLAATAKQNDLDMLSKYTASYISDSYGVAGLANVKAEYDNDHKLLFTANVVAAETGESVGVTIDGIL